MQSKCNLNSTFKIVYKVQKKKSEKENFYWKSHDGRKNHCDGFQMFLLH